nr:hypothetical protein [Bradyrhizobium sp. 157]
MQKPRSDQLQSPKDLAEEARRLREEAKLLPPGPVRDAALRKAREDETAAQLIDWINSPGLKSPA